MAAKRGTTRASRPSAPARASEPAGAVPEPADPPSADQPPAAAPATVQAATDQAGADQAGADRAATVQAAADQAAADQAAADRAAGPAGEPEPEAAAPPEPTNRAERRALAKGRGAPPPAGRGVKQYGRTAPAAPTPRHWQGRRGG
jgi:hypothetical protein